MRYAQDGMVYVRTFGKPDLFITFTCNPKWVEIMDEPLEEQPQDRQDITAKRSGTNQNEAEKVLDLVSAIREVLIVELSQGQPGNKPCVSTQELRNLRMDMFQELNAILTSNTSEGAVCGGLSMSPAIHQRVRQIITEDRRFRGALQILHNQPDYVLNLLRKKALKMTKPLLTGLLLNSRYVINTPDFITLLHNIAQEFHSSNMKLDGVMVYEGNYGVAGLVEGVLARNDLSPSTTYQARQFISAMVNIRPGSPNHLLFLMRKDDYPVDVIAARNTILTAIVSGSLRIDNLIGWENQPDTLMALLTDLLKVPNNHHLAPSIHVVYAHYRLKYLAWNGYTFYPRDNSDIAFLLNSFLTIRSPALLQAMFMEFTRDELPWQDLIATLDFSEYSNPRVLFLEIVRMIVNHPESLKICNTILFEYFLNADEKTTPEWLQVIFPNNFNHSEPIDVTRIVKSPIPQPVLDSNCPGKEITIVDPESIIEIIDSDYHMDLIMDLIRNNPMVAENFPYTTRLSAFKGILEELKSTMYRGDVSEFIISQAILRVPTSEKGSLPIDFINICPDQLDKLREKAQHLLPSETPQAPPIYVSEITTERYDECEIEEPAPVESCKKVVVINQSSLLNITTDKHLRAIKEIVYMMPVFYNDYKNLDTRKEVFLKVLADRQALLNDDILDLVIPQAIMRLPISWAGSLPPIVEEICEDELMYNITFPPGESSEEIEPKLSCTDEKTINPYTLIELLPRNSHTKSIEKLILSKPILAEDYKDYTNRAGVFKAVLITRSEEIDRFETTFDVKRAVSRIKLNWKATLPIDYLELCPKSPKPTLDNFFDDVVDGLGEATIPCEIEPATEPTQIALPSATIEESIDFPSTEQLMVENSRTCPANEVPTKIVVVDSLFDALSETAPKAPYIRAKAKSFVVPIENDVQYSKGQILQQILESMRDEIKDARILLNLEQLIKCILQDGPALEPPQTTMTCLSAKALEDAAATDKPNCKPDEILTTVVYIESLFDALEEWAPKAPYIKSKINTYVVPIEEDKIYTKREILIDILTNIKEEIADQRVLRNLESLMKSIKKDGAAFDEPETQDVCVPESILSETLMNTEITTQSTEILQPTLSPLIPQIHPAQPTISHMAPQTYTTQPTVSPFFPQMHTSQPTVPSLAPQIHTVWPQPTESPWAQTTPTPSTTQSSYSHRPTGTTGLSWSGAITPSPYRPGHQSSASAAASASTVEPLTSDSQIFETTTPTWISLSPSTIGTASSSASSSTPIYPSSPSRPTTGTSPITAGNSVTNTILKPTVPTILYPHIPSTTEVNYMALTTPSRWETDAPMIGSRPAYTTPGIYRPTVISSTTAEAYVDTDTGVDTSTTLIQSTTSAECEEGEETELPTGTAHTSTSASASAAESGSLEAQGTTPLPLSSPIMVPTITTMEPECRDDEVLPTTTTEVPNCEDSENLSIPEHQESIPPPMDSPLPTTPTLTTSAAASAATSSAVPSMTPTWSNSPAVPSTTPMWTTYPASPVDASAGASAATSSVATSITPMWTTSAAVPSTTPMWTTYPAIPSTTPMWTIYPALPSTTPMWTTYPAIPSTTPMWTTYPASPVDASTAASAATSSAAPSITPMWTTSTAVPPTTPMWTTSPAAPTAASAATSAAVPSMTPMWTTSADVPSTTPKWTSSAAASAAASAASSSTEGGPEGGDTGESCEEEDQVTTTTTTPKPPPCHQPEIIIDPESLLKPISQSAQESAKDITKLIKNSSILQSSFETETACEITISILQKMRITAESKLASLRLQSRSSREVKKWLEQIKILLENISCEGEGGQPPAVISRCIYHKNKEIS